METHLNNRRYQRALTSFQRATIAKEKNKRTTVVQSAKTDKSRVHRDHSMNAGSGEEQKGFHGAFTRNLHNPAALDDDTILNDAGSIRTHLDVIGDPI